MNELNPQARALVEAARRGGRVVPPARRGRMRRAVLGLFTLSSTATAGTLTLGKVVMVAMASAAVGSGVTAVVSHSLASDASHRVPPAEAHHGDVPSAPPVLAGERSERATGAAEPRVASSSPHPAEVGTQNGQSDSAPPEKPAQGEVAVHQPPVPSVVATPLEAPLAGGDARVEDGARRSESPPRRERSEAEVRSAALLHRLSAVLPPPIEAPQRAPRLALEDETPEIPPPAPKATRRPRPAGEAEALMVAYTAVAEHRWVEATSVLDAYGRDFEGGALTVEADVLRVLVLCGEGRAGAASALTERLAARAPTNPAVQRLAPACGAPR